MSNLNIQIILADNGKWQPEKPVPNQISISDLYTFSHWKWFYITQKRSVMSKYNTVGSHSQIQRSKHICSTDWTLYMPK